MSSNSGAAGSGDGSTDDFFNDMLNKQAASRAQQQSTVARAASATPPVGQASAMPRQRRAAAPPPQPQGSKRPVTSSSAPQRPTSSSSSATGLRKASSSSSTGRAATSAPSSVAAAKPTPSYYLNSDHSRNGGSRENLNHAAAVASTNSNTFYPAPAAAATTTSSTSSYYGSAAAVPGTDSSHLDWYTPSTMTTAAAVPTPSMPTVMNPYMPQPVGSMDTISSQATDPSYLAGDDPYANEPPLMEELGINVEHIVWKTRAVVLPFSRRVFRIRNRGFHDDNEDQDPRHTPQAMAQDADLAGPVAFAVLLGAELLLAGKLQFGYIYGFGLFGCLSMTLILNLLQPQGEVARLTTSDPTLPAAAAAAAGISFWSVTSILGYALLPVNGLAAFKLLLVNNPFWKLHTLLRSLAVIIIAWSTIASTRLFEQGFGFRDQRYLIAYPIALLYSAFVLITIF